MLVSYLIPYGSLIWLCVCALFMQLLGHWKTIGLFLAYQTFLMLPFLPILYDLESAIPQITGEAATLMYLGSVAFAYLFLLAILFFLHKFFHAAGLFRRFGF
jgi:hypothetical protein